MNLFEIEREKYWDMPISYDRQKRQQIIENAFDSGLYMASEKIDGNWACFVKQNGVAKIQSRGKKKGTGEYGELQEKVPHIYNELCSFFTDIGEELFLIGELYIPNTTSNEATSILNSLPPRAKKMQEQLGLMHFMIFDIWYFNVSYMNEPYENRIKSLQAIANSELKQEHIHLAYFEFKPENMRQLWSDVLARGGEGIVLQKRMGKPEPGKRPARKSIKLKKEIEADVFVIGTEPSLPDFTGKHLEDCKYWYNEKTQEYKQGLFYTEYVGGAPIHPISKGFFYGWPRALRCGVYTEDGSVHEIGNIPNLTEALAEDLKNNPEKYKNRVLRVAGMELTDDKMIRHPKFLNFRDDMSPEECTLSKIIG